MSSILKKSFHIFVIILLACTMLFNIPKASAVGVCDLTPEEMKFYAKNNILYYCPHTKVTTADGVEITCMSISNGSGDNPSKAFGFFIEKGYSKTTAAAIVGNLMQESYPTLDTNVIENGRVVEDGFRIWPKTFNGGFGIAQWTTDARKQALQAFADSKNLPVTSLQVQLEYLYTEMTDPNYRQYLIGTANFSTSSEFNSMSLEDAILYFIRHFENPQAQDSIELQRRLPFAQQVLGLEPSDPGFATECADGGGNASLISGGMDIGEAQSLMEIYRNCASNTGIRTGTECAGAHVDVPSDGACTGGTLNNCSAFSQWFVNKYTSLNSGLYQGSQFVNQLAAKGVETGRIPKLYAVFSMGPFSGTADGWPNHTGVVLGIDEASDTIIIGEASCSRGFTNYYPGAHKESLSKYTNSSSPYGPTYAYINVNGL